MTHPLRERRVDGVLADIPLDAEVIRARPLILGQVAALHLVLVRRIPCAQDDLTTAAHSLRVGGHHADGAEVVQHVLGGDGFGADARLGKRHVLGDVLGQVMTHHQHVQVLVQRVARVGARRVRAAGQHVGVLHHADDVGCVPTARTLGVVRVDGPPLERGDCALHEAGLVERVGMDQTLHVQLVADAEARVDGRRRAAPILVQLEAARPGDDLFAQGFRVAVVAFAGDADIDRDAVACLKHLAHVIGAGGACCRGCASTVLSGQ